MMCYDLCHTFSSLNYFHWHIQLSKTNFYTNFLLHEVWRWLDVFSSLYCHRPPSLRATDYNTVLNIYFKHKHGNFVSCLACRERSNAYYQCFSLVIQIYSKGNNIPSCELNRLTVSFNLYQSEWWKICCNRRTKLKLKVSWNTYSLCLLLVSDINQNTCSFKRLQLSCLVMSFNWAFSPSPTQFG